MKTTICNRQYAWDLDFQDYTISDRHIIVERGFLRKTTDTIPAYKMISAKMYRSCLQRMLGLCTIVVKVAGSEDLELRDIPFDRQLYIELQNNIEDTFYKTFMVYRQLQMYGRMPYQGAYIDCNDEEYDD